MNTSDFYYDLPPELIAQDPLADRSSSRLLRLSKTDGLISHHIFKELPEFLNPGDVLVINNTKVIPARLIGERKGSGGKAEILLLTRKGKDVWECLVKPGKKCREGAVIGFGEKDEKGNYQLEGEIVSILTEGNRLVNFTYEGTFEQTLSMLGEMPIPPYIHNKLTDKERYNTVYAKFDGSAAAPTAGLHFTDELLEEIREKGVNIAPVTLHVGLGTFRPVKAERLEDHHMHSEYCEISEESAALMNEAHAKGRRIVCVGTTSMRTVESFANDDGTVRSGSAWTDIFIYPGCRIRAVDALITNFHLPESTLIMLVSALAGRENVLRAYEEAVKERYRFYSFGDAMMIE